MYQAIVNKVTMSVTLGESVTVDGNLIQWDCIKIADDHFHAIHQHKSYRIRVIKADYANKVFTIKINGRFYSIVLKDKLDMAMEKMGMRSKTSSTTRLVMSPMPGLVLDLKVSVGDNVKRGDPILVLEAMKMENTLKSSHDGKVKKVNVKRGDSVEKGQILIEF